MTKEEIIEIANKIKLPHEYANGEPMWLDKLEEFAKLVAEKEREACAECGADGGHALYCVACAEKFLVFLVKKAIEQEREACAKIADSYADGLERNYSEIIVDKIRARGQE